MIQQSFIWNTVVHLISNTFISKHTWYIILLWLYQHQYIKHYILNCKYSISKDLIYCGFSMNIKSLHIFNILKHACPFSKQV